MGILDPKPQTAASLDAHPRLSATALNATYATTAAATTKARAAVNTSGGARFAHLGDSLSTTVSGGANAHWAWVMALYSKGQLVHALDAGIAGNTSAQILARVPSVVSAGVRYCTVLAGTNDHDSAVTIANLPQIYDALIAGGVEPIPVLMIPSNTALELPIIAKVNAWISAYAERRGWLVLDPHTPLVDPATGNFAAGLNFDAGHMNETGHLLVGRAFAKQLEGKLGGWTPSLTNHVSDALNISGEGVMLTPNGGNANNAAMWTSGFVSVGSGTTANISTSLVPTTPTEGIKGNWQRITLNAGNIGRYTFRKTITAGSGTFAVGDLLRCGFKVRSAGLEGGKGTVTVAIGFTGTSPFISREPLRTWSADVDGTFVDEMVVPAGTTAISFEFLAASTTALAAQATAEIAAVTWRNLTKLGIAQV